MALTSDPAALTSDPVLTRDVAITLNIAESRRKRWPWSVAKSLLLLKNCVRVFRIGKRKTL